jgi:transposase
MPKRYGNWNSVFVRFSRWSKLGIWDAVLETLASLGPPADAEQAIDSTIVRGAPTCCRRKRGNQEKQALGRSRGGFSTKIHPPTLMAIRSPSS